MISTTVALVVDLATCEYLISVATEIEVAERITTAILIREAVVPEVIENPTWATLLESEAVAALVVVLVMYETRVSAPVETDTAENPTLTIDLAIATTVKLVAER